MVKKLFVYVFITLCFSDAICQEVVNITDTNGLKQGVWEEKVNEGNIVRLVGNYENGEKHGQLKAYYSNNQIAVVANYKLGQLNGKVVNYYDNGELKIESNFLEGKKHGTFKEFWKNGKKKSIKKYCSDTICGNYMEYYENGKLNIKVTESEKGNENWFVNHENGKIKLTGLKIDNINIGEWKEYSEKGKLIKIFNYKSGEVVRERTYEKGKLIEDK